MMYNNKLVCSVKVNGKILREKIQNGNSSVFIPFGSEYSLIFKNLSGRNALVHVEIDGREINEAKNGFYLKAGATAEIEGFEKNYKVDRKFKFIQKTQEISDFRGDRIDDGMIRITWQFEKPVPEVKKITIEEVWKRKKIFPRWFYCYNCHKWHWDNEYCMNYYHEYLPYYDNNTIPNDPFNDRTICCNNLSNNFSDNRILRGGFVGGGGGTQSQSIGSSANVTYSSKFGENISKFSDEGITVEGSKSNQSFGQAYIKELEENVNSMVILLKGCDTKKQVIAQPITVDLKKVCSSCGRKYKGNIEFCPKDGTALKQEKKWGKDCF